MTANLDSSLTKYNFTFEDCTGSIRNFKTDIEYPYDVPWEEPLTAFIHFLSMVYGYDISTNVKINHISTQEPDYYSQYAGLSD